MPSSPPEEPRSPEKLDARLAAVMRLPGDVVRDILARDQPRRDRFAGALPAGPILAAPPPLPAIRALHGVAADANGELVASVLIRFQGDAARLASAGARVRSIAGDIATADVPLRALGAIEQDPDVIFIELAQPLVVLVDTSVPAMGVAALHHAASPLRGAGVLVGVVDLDGLELRHPDFSRAGSDPPATRILRLWNQNDAGDGRAPEPFGYGVEHTREEIDREVAAAAPYSVVRARPTGGHGTHVTGIAAGNGRASQGRCMGVAPEADIVFVNLRSEPGEAVGSTPALIDALRYVFAQAERRPCVANVSLGTLSGPRDGTSLTEQAIDALVKTTGHAVVVAAGNDGERRRHKQASILAEGQQIAEFVVPAGTVRPDVVEIWYPGRERLDVTILTPREAAVGPVAPGGYASAVLEDTRVTVFSMVGDARNGGCCIQILIQPAEARSIPRGRWRILLARSVGSPAPGAESRYHATITGSSGAVWVEASTSCTLASPGTAEEVITVANHLHGYAWTASSSSSHGPTRDGRPKPDLAAPGTGIWSARAAPRPGARTEWYVQSTGTSMAAPHVAGLAALLYQRDGRIAPRALKTMLRALADRTGLTDDWTPALGWGRARAPAARHDSRLATEPRGAVTSGSCVVRVADTHERGEEAMKNVTTTNRTRGGILALRAPSGRDEGQLQIDIGDYIIYVGETQVGEVFVEADPDYPDDAAHTVEHWCLFREYPQPSASNDSQTLQFCYREGVYGSASDFLTYVRTVSGARYIKALCREQAP